MENNLNVVGIIRALDDLGRIVIPKEMRTKMDIRSNDSVEIYVEDDKIILTRYTPSCIFCGESDNLTVFKDKKVCADCIAQLMA